jgi:cobalt-zinc-cadmium efflux system membrane fusion protein
VVADLSTVWVDINVYPKDLEHVRPGNIVRVEASNIKRETEGKISFIGPVVSEHTRTAVARVVLPNPENVWRPGMFVTAQVATASVEAALVVTREAIQTIEGKPSVFVETETGAFRAQAVTLGRKSERDVEISSGLKAGDKYVSKGTFVLKAELGKAAAGHSHD